MWIERNDTLRIKGIAIICVVFGHLTVIEYGGAIGVGLFLFVSGYGIYDSFLKRGLENFWKKRIYNIYFPYMVAIILQFLIRRTTDIGTIIFSLFGLDFGKIVDGTMWYISYIFFWYFWFWIIEIIKTRFNFSETSYISCVDILALILVGIAQYFMSHNWHFLWEETRGAELYSIIFPLGCLYRRCLDKSERIIKLLFTFATCASIVILYKHYRYIEGNHKLLWLSIYTISTTVLLVGFVIGLRKFKGGVLRILEFIGEKSYAIYLLEGLFISLVIRIDRSVYGNLLPAFMVFFVILVASTCFHDTVIIPINSLLKANYDNRGKSESINS